MAPYSTSLLGLGWLSNWNTPPPLLSASTARPSASIPCRPRPDTQCPYRPLKSCAAGPFLQPLPPSICLSVCHPQSGKHPCCTQWVLPSAELSLLIHRPRPIPLPAALDLPPSTTVCPNNFRAASLWFYCNPTCMIPPLSPLCWPAYWCFLVSSDDWIIFILVSFFALDRCQGASTTWQYFVPALTHVLFNHEGTVHPPPPYPIDFLIHSPLVKLGGV